MTGGPPISRHPAFSAVVGLWCACLLGVGSVVLPVALIERLVAISGVAALSPAATPPIGFTTRAVIAAVAGLAGALIGVAIARRAVRAHEGDDQAVGTRRPILAHEELGEVSLVDGFGPPVGPRSTPADGASGSAGECPAMAPRSIAPDDDDDPSPERGALARYAIELAEQRRQPAGASVPFPAPSLSRRGPAPPQAGPAGVSPTVPFGEPDMVQLVQSLRASIARRRARQDAVNPAPAAPLSGPGPARAEDAEQGVAAYFGKPALVSSGGRRNATVAKSLPRDQAKTDAALRAALGTLQRLSGNV